MHLRLAVNLQHFLPDLSALYALRFLPNFYEIHPRLWLNVHCIAEYTQINSSI
jgi:hypothetical protein